MIRTCLLLAPPEYDESVYLDLWLTRDFFDAYLERVAFDRLSDLSSRALIVPSGDSVSDSEVFSSELEFFFTVFY